MMAEHCRPLGGTPVTARIQAVNNNCYGAVLSALYGFWAARETAATHSGSIRRDAYSIILEGTTPEVSPYFPCCPAFSAVSKTFTNEAHRLF